MGMSLFWKRQESVINRINDYLEQVDVCRDQFRLCMKHLITEESSGEESDVLVDRVHRAESKADDLRREIEMELYRRALIPESRGDVLGLLESFDKIPGNFESLCYQMSLQRIVFPQAMQPGALDLVEVNLEAYGSLRAAFVNLFYNRPVRDLVGQIDQRESDSDRIERRMIKDLFDSPMDKADRILLKEVVLNIGNISDLALSTSDRLTIAVVKRRI